MRWFVLILALPFASVFGPVQSSAESYTTRIEPRPFYGAVVTIEEGVRVFRPLPPVRHMIVNPGGQTPLYLSVYDNHNSENGVAPSDETGTSNGGGYSDGGNGGYSGGAYGAPYNGGNNIGPRGHKKERHEQRSPMGPPNPFAKDGKNMHGPNGGDRHHAMPANASGPAKFAHGAIGVRH